MNQQNEQSSEASLPGELLKRARLKAGLTQEQLAKRSRLTVHNIQALEDNDWHVLPALVYVRGFIRIYAKEVGVDAVQAIKRLDICLAEEQEAKERGLLDLPFQYTSPKNSEYLNAWRNQYWGTVTIAFVVAFVLMSLLSLSPSTLEANEEDHKISNTQTLDP